MVKAIIRDPIAVAGAVSGIGRDGEKRLLEDREDERAIRAFLGGDREAFNCLVGKYRSQVYRICFRFTGDHHDADDQAQEVFLRAFRGLPRFRGQAQFSTWLYRITVNTCLNWRAGRKVHTEQLLDNLTDPAPGQIERLSREQRALAVRKAIAKLPAKQRMTLVLRAFHDLSHREIAEVMESPVGTVKANFYFALQNLKKVLEDWGLPSHD